MRRAQPAWPGRVLATALAVLLISQSFVLPLLDRGESGQGTVIESEHDASLCVRGHDHTICNQYGAGRPLAASPPRHQTTVTTVSGRTPARVDGFHFSL